MALAGRHSTIHLWLVRMCLNTALWHSATATADTSVTASCRLEHGFAEHQCRLGHSMAGGQLPGCGDATEAEATDQVLLLQLSHEFRAVEKLAAPTEEAGQNGSSALSLQRMLPSLSGSLEAPWEDAAPGASNYHAYVLPTRHWHRDSQLHNHEGRLALLGLSSTGLTTLGILLLIVGLIAFCVVLITLIMAIPGQETEGKAPTPKAPSPAPLSRRDSFGPAASLLSADSSAPAPPPLCPSMVLPRTPVSFLIPSDQITGVKSSGTSTMDIIGPSGRKMFVVNVDLSDMGGKTLAICAAGCDDDPHAVIVNSLGSSSLGSSTKSSRNLQILGRGGKLYGDLERTSSGAHVINEDEKVIRLLSGRQELMEIKALAMNGQQLATASSEEGPEEMVWKFEASPGSDALLLASCMLSMLLKL
mmetsp:Transcript_63569/g.185874  ORF Transcript_63569/g.185874 Transcript_63569/m.185874 type:complete len:418 (+) Transcript_63569:95-1348(+)